MILSHFSVKVACHHAIIRPNSWSGIFPSAALDVSLINLFEVFFNYCPFDGSGSKKPQNIQWIVMFHSTIIMLRDHQNCWSDIVFVFIFYVRINIRMGNAQSNGQQWLTRVYLHEVGLRAAYSVTFNWAYLFNS